MGTIVRVTILLAAAFTLACSGGESQPTEQKRPKRRGGTTSHATSHIATDFTAHVTASKAG